MKPDTITMEHDTGTVAEAEIEFNQLRARVEQLEVTVARLHNLVGLNYSPPGTSYLEVTAMLAELSHMVANKEVSSEGAYELIGFFGSVTKEYVGLVCKYTAVSTSWRILTDSASLLVQLIQHNPNPYTQTLYPYAVAARNNCVAHVMDYLTTEGDYAQLSSVNLPARDLHDAILTLLPTVSDLVKLA